MSKAISSIIVEHSATIQAAVVRDPSRSPFVLRSIMISDDETGHATNGVSQGQGFINLRNTEAAEDVNGSAHSVVTFKVDPSGEEGGGEVVEGGSGPVELTGIHGGRVEEVGGAHGPTITRRGGTLHSNGDLGGRRSLFSALSLELLEECLGVERGEEPRERREVAHPGLLVAGPGFPCQWRPRRRAGGGRLGRPGLFDLFCDDVWSCAAVRSW